MKIRTTALMALALLVGNNQLWAQTLTQLQSSQTANDLAVMVQAVEQTTPAAAATAPLTGTFYSALNPNFPPMPGNLNQLPVWNLGNGLYLLDDTDVDYTTPKRAGGMMAMDASGPPSPGGGGSGTNSYPQFTNNFSIDTNSLWLELTNVADGLAYVNLHNATDYVYEIFSKTNLLATNWNIETEVFPSDPNTMPFMVSQLNRTNLSLWARDWTGITSNGNETPDWWFWEYFGTVDLTDTNLDNLGNTFLYDYQNSLNPNIIQFSIQITNSYVRTNNPPLQINVTGGIPAYYTVQVDDTNYASDAVWSNYSGSNVMVNLGITEGWHNVWIGLRGHGDNPTNAVWGWNQLDLDLTPPALVITNPVIVGGSATVTVPLLQLQGFSPEALQGVSCSISNSAGNNPNLFAALTSQSFDPNSGEVTTNGFQAYDLPLVAGTNRITFQASDLAGNVTTTNFTVTLDYSDATNPAAPMLFWPPDGTTIGGTNFTLQGSVNDPTATVTVTIVDTNGKTNVVQGVVNRNGQFLAGNVPVGSGASSVTITTTSAAGNSSATNFTVTGLDAGLTMNPLIDIQPTNTSVNVSGSIDAGYSLTVNGVQATVSGDPTWTATVPLPAGNPANFDVKLYNSDNALVAEQMFSQWLPPVVHATSYDSLEFNHYYQYGYGDCNERELVGYDDWFSWNDQDGGTNYEEDYNWSSYCGDPKTTNDYTYFDPTNDLNMYNPHASAYPSYNWEYGDISAWAAPDEEEYYRTRTKVVIDPNGQGTAGVTQNYLVWASAIELRWDNDPSFEALPPEWLQVQGQTLANSGLTNNFSVFGDEDIAVLGYTVVTAPAGTLVDVTPVAMQTYNDNYYQIDDHNGYYPITDYQFDVQTCEFPAPVTDNNRDGKITFDGGDDTTAARPFHFWVNDSQEGGDIVSGSDDQIPGSSSPNCELNHVNGRSDLVNFFPVALNLGGILQQCPLTNGFEYHLSQADSAVKFVYTSLTTGNAFDYLTDATATDGYGVDGSEPPQSADTIQVTSGGTMLETNWLARVQTNSGVGIVLLEGCAASTAPLMLEVWHKDQNGVEHKLGGVPMYLSISGVEQMFRHLDLRDGADAPSGLSGDTSVRDNDPSLSTSMGEPGNMPDSESNGRWFIFVVGSNVGGQSSRGWESEVFKRLYWSGNKAKFAGVSWYGDPRADDNDLIYDYHMAVRNAFATAPTLASFVNGLSGNKTIAGHSLGCGLIAFALSDDGMSVNNACLMDAAFAQECFDGDLDDNLTAMRPSAWQDYPQELWAAHWHEQFDTNDARSTLTWRNRFANALASGANVYSFYSSTEDVLGEFDGTPTEALVEDAFGALTGGDYSSYVWVLQEKCKGDKINLLGLAHVGSDYGGWGFNVMDGYLTNYPIWYDVPPCNCTRTVKTPTEIGTVTQEMLDGSKYNPLFKNGWGAFDVDNASNVYVNVDTSYFTGPNWILGLFQPNQGSTVAADPVKRNQLLAEAIPALSLPVGANQTIAFGNNQFNMPAQFANAANWPRDKQTGTDIPFWFHSDMGQIAYPLIHGLYDKLVSISNQ